MEPTRLAPCEGNCRYGDALFVSWKDVLEYDGSRCGCVKCANYPVCPQSFSPASPMGTTPGICAGCDATLGRILPKLPLDVCPACSTAQLPGATGVCPWVCATHPVCTRCSRAHLGVRRAHVPNPFQFGAPARVWHDGWADDDDAAEQAAVDAWMATRDAALFHDEVSSFENELSLHARGEHCPVCRAMPVARDRRELD
jgi:hypothetical protein